jgi:hypothetical protein
LKSNHLEIGPGSGYFLNPSNHNKNINKLKLMDINLPILKYSKNNLLKCYPNVKIIEHNIFEDKIELGDIESVGINYLLHCVPGNLEKKIDKLVSNLPDNINIFGSSVINDTDKQNILSNLELKFLNKYGM